MPYIISLKKCKPKTSMRFLLTRMAIIKKGDSKSGKDVEKLELAYIAGENLKWYNHFGKHLAVPQKVKY